MPINSINKLSRKSTYVAKQYKDEKRGNRNVKSAIKHLENRTESKMDC